MIERQFIKDNFKLFKIQEYLASNLKNVGLSHVKLQRTPLGDQIVIFASRPGLVVGRKGANIKSLTSGLKKRFDLQNPQIEISEVENVFTNARIVAEKISGAMERFGSNRFKGIMHKSLEDTLRAGALGVEIVLSGKLPSSRARRWRVSAGYLKKCGDSAISQVDVAYAVSNLKTGSVGIKVSIIPADVVLPDKVELRTAAQVEEQLAQLKAEAEAEEANAKKKKKPAKRKTATKKKAAKKKEAKEEAPAEDKSAESAPESSSTDAPAAEENQNPKKEEENP